MEIRGKSAGRIKLRRWWHLAVMAVLRGGYCSILGLGMSAGARETEREKHVPDPVISESEPPNLGAISTLQDKGPWSKYPVMRCSERWGRKESSIKRADLRFGGRNTIVSRSLRLLVPTCPGTARSSLPVSEAHPPTDTPGHIFLILTAAAGLVCG
ncbi:hypothetical protein RRG08_004814 [Elysia crispata]|uniref:Uncharacterized protein n=1 Tax=Elysia crispata TaxID=231223 RepID=A0AAE0Y585_9GAST|nr:hypothetical protein RRG08_004814 [Elysia crispata]